MGSMWEKGEGGGRDNSGKEGVEGGPYRLNTNQVSKHCSY